MKVFFLPLVEPFSATKPRDELQVDSVPPGLAGPSITWDQDVAEAQEGEGPVAERQRGGVQPRHLEHHGKLEETPPLALTFPLSRREAWTSKSPAHLFVRGGVGGTGRHLHHDALAALWRKKAIGDSSVRRRMCE